MRKLFLSACAALGVAMCMSGGAQAQSGGGYPDGDWSRSCYNESIQDGVLEAECQGRRGGSLISSLDLTRCNASVTNDNGRLRCYGRAARFPAGSWSYSCEYGYIARDVLYAQCQDGRGRYREASLRLRGCDSAENVDGRLVCGDDLAALPGGGWASTCRNGEMRRNVLSAECRDQRNKWRSSSLDMRSCPRNSAENMNGSLVCTP